MWGFCRFQKERLKVCKTTLFADFCAKSAVLHTFRRSFCFSAETPLFPQINCLAISALSLVLKFISLAAESRKWEKMAENWKIPHAGNGENGPIMAQMWKLFGAIFLIGHFFLIFLWQPVIHLYQATWLAILVLFSFSPLHICLGMSNPYDGWDLSERSGHCRIAKRLQLSVARPLKEKALCATVANTIASSWSPLLQVPRRPEVQQSRVHEYDAWFVILRACYRDKKNRWIPDIQRKTQSPSQFFLLWNSRFLFACSVAVFCVLPGFWGLCALYQSRRIAMLGRVAYRKCV